LDPLLTVGTGSKQWNYNQFPVNGAAFQNMPGTFATEIALGCRGRLEGTYTPDPALPFRIYLEILHPNGIDVLWQSELRTLNYGLQDFRLRADSWICNSSSSNCILDQQVILIPDNPQFPGPQTSQVCAHLTETQVTQLVVPVADVTNLPFISITSGCVDCGDPDCDPLSDWNLGDWVFNAGDHSYTTTLYASSGSTGCCACVHLDYIGASSLSFDVQSMGIPHGISLAVDCDGNMYFTAGSTLYVWNNYPSDPVTNFPTRDAANNPVVIDEISWDATNNILWGACCWPSIGLGVGVYMITPTGLCTWQFNVSEPGWPYGGADGLAYDPDPTWPGGSIWLSWDQNNYALHYTTNGAFIGSISLPMNASNPGNISGICASPYGIWAARIGAEVITLHNKSGGLPIQTISTASLSLVEGIECECDPAGFPPGTCLLWAKDNGNPHTVNAFPIQAGSCPCEPSSAQCIPDPQVILTPDNPQFPGQQTAHACAHLTESQITQLIVPVTNATNLPVISITSGCIDCGDPQCEPLSAWNLGAWVFSASDNAYTATLSAASGATGCCVCVHLDFVLPVELSSFTATAGDNSVLLNWITTSETALAHFEILRDGSRVAVVGAAGFASAQHSYAWTDDQALNGTTHTYTLVAVALNGNREELRSVSATPSESHAMVTEYSLHQNYPNPFNPSTEIVFDMKEAGVVAIRVYNMLGQEMKSLISGNASAGRHSITFDATGLPSGLYFCKMETDNGFTAQKKMLLLK
jgi:hypothetical protein